METINAKMVTRSDSLKNWRISWPRTEPIAFRMPTSLARFSDRAVDKFIKLMQARISTKMPMMAYSRTNLILPPTLIPPSKSE